MGCEILQQVAASPALTGHISEQYQMKHFLVMILSLLAHGVEKGGDQDIHCVQILGMKTEGCNQ